MQSGFYSLGTGMVSQAIALNHLTDNITYSLVPGYKKQEVYFHSFDEDLKKEVSKIHPFAESDVASGIKTIQGITDFSQGPLQNTGDNEDIALEGDGFFEVDTGHGHFYMRSGKFIVNQDRNLVTKEGYKVIGVDGSSISFDAALPNPNKFKIGEDGSVTLIDDSKTPAKIASIGKIAIHNFEKPENLKRAGYGLWVEEDNSSEKTSSTAKVRQGFKEMSNISSIEAMVELMVNQRLYDTNANALKEMHSNMQEFIKAIFS